jgi:hypothetical protein
VVEQEDRRRVHDRPGYTESPLSLGESRDRSADQRTTVGSVHAANAAHTGSQGGLERVVSPTIRRPAVRGRPTGAASLDH